MNAEPLSKEIFEKATKLGVEEIELRFSGGDDEGYLNVDFTLSEDNNANDDLLDDVTKWAWQVYDFSGAGDGNGYGDDITYNLTEGTVTSSNWWMERQESDRDMDKLKVK